MPFPPFDGTLHWFERLVGVATNKAAKNAQTQWLLHVGSRDHPLYGALQPLLRLGNELLKVQPVLQSAVIYAACSTKLPARQN